MFWLIVAQFFPGTNRAATVRARLRWGLLDSLVLMRVLMMMTVGISMTTPMIRTSLKNKLGTDHATCSQKVAFRHLQRLFGPLVKKALMMRARNQFQYLFIDKL